MTSYLKFLFVFIWLGNTFCHSSFAENFCGSYLESESILFEHFFPISFENVEVFRRNNDIGLQQIGKLKFKQWSELTFEYSDDVDNAVTSLVGLTESGRIYHLIKFKDRTLARLLSGENNFKDFQVSNKGRVIAWDNDDKNFIYSSALWMESPKKSILKRWLALWGFSTAIVVSAKAVLMGDLYFPIEVFSFDINLPLVELLLSGTAGMSSGLAMLSRYDHLNTYPNGFLPFKEPLSRSNWLENLDLKTLVAENHYDFAPPEPDLLSPKIPANLGEGIR